MKIFEDIYNSFKNNDNGFSARKLSGFVAIKTAVILSYKNCTPDNVFNLTICWLLFALLCMGLVTFQNIIDFKNGKDA